METTATLLNQRERLSLQWARAFLATRVRTRTPLGAAEYLEMKAERAEDLYRVRLKIALDCMQLYRALFPDEYSRSAAPHLSTQREHEFYKLVHTREHCFPLIVEEDVDLRDLLDANPTFCLNFIPVRGVQKHTWAPDGFEFENVELCFQLALVLCWIAEADEAWKNFCEMYGLDLERPAPPIASVGWTQFTYACSVQDTPLRFLPLAFNMITYRTGNPWLDLPPVGYIGFDWNLQNMMKLSIAWAQAKDWSNAMTVLNRWLLEDPKMRIAAAVNIWNKAAEIEAQSGLAGMLVEDLLERGDLAALDHAVAVLRTNLIPCAMENHTDERQ